LVDLVVNDGAGFAVAVAVVVALPVAVAVAVGIGVETVARSQVARPGAPTARNPAGQTHAPEASSTPGAHRVRASRPQSSPSQPATADALAAPFSPPPPPTLGSFVVAVEVVCSGAALAEATGAVAVALVEPVPVPSAERQPSPTSGARTSSGRRRSRRIVSTSYRSADDRATPETPTSPRVRCAS
jgi:hypothetical protein